MNYLVACALLLFVLGWVASVYLRLVRLRGGVVVAWMQIERELKQRCELLERLLKLPASSISEDGKCLSQVLRLNASSEEILKNPSLFDDSESMERLNDCEAELRRALEELFVSFERVPELMNLLSGPQLKHEIGMSQHLLSRLKRSYNGSVTLYNDGVCAFPGTIVARAFHFGEASFLD